MSQLVLAGDGKNSIKKVLIVFLFFLFTYSFCVYVRGTGGVISVANYSDLFDR